MVFEHTGTITRPATDNRTRDEYGLPEGDQPTATKIYSGTVQVQDKPAEVALAGTAASGAVEGTTVVIADGTVRLQRRPSENIDVDTDQLSVTYNGVERTARILGVAHHKHHPKLFIRWNDQA